MTTGNPWIGNILCAMYHHCLINRARRHVPMREHIDTGFSSNMEFHHRVYHTQRSFFFRVVTLGISVYVEHYFQHSMTSFLPCQVLPLLQAHLLLASNHFHLTISRPVSCPCSVAWIPHLELSKSFSMLASHLKFYRYIEHFSTFSVSLFRSGTLSLWGSMSIHGPLTLPNNLRLNELLTLISTVLSITSRKRCSCSIMCALHDPSFLFIFW